jgi:hypothetical protein
MATASTGRSAQCPCRSVVLRSQANGSAKNEGRLTDIVISVISAYALMRTPSPH